MGAQSFAEVKRTERVETQAQVNNYVRCVAQAILKESGNSGPWEIVVFKDPAVNAFALPGGRIGVYTGLLELTENQQQLATVIAHEVGHVMANHANERLSQALAVQGGLSVVDSLAKNPSSANHQLVMQALGLGAKYGILLPYSRTQESEADLIGLELMARAGFDPRQSVALWHNMMRVGGNQPPPFLSTHPSQGSRIQELEANMGRALQLYQAARAQGKSPRCG
jgi:predicted Zn-dependent protease